MSFHMPPLPLDVLNVGLGIPELIGDDTVDTECAMLMIELRGVLRVVVERIEFLVSLGDNEAAVNEDELVVLRCDFWDLIKAALDANWVGDCGSYSRVHLRLSVSMILKR